MTPKQKQHIKMIIELPETPADPEKQYSFRKVRKLLKGIKGDMSKEIILERNEEQNMISMTRIKNFSQRIANEFKPKRIILFGSHAGGSPTQDSDVDLLTEMPFKGRSVEKSVEIRMKLLPDFPLDLLVRTPENIEQRLSMGDFFMHDIIHKGKVLYETCS